MSAKNNFLVGCGAGVAATLVAVTLLPRKLSHSSRSREADPGLLENPRAEADPRNGVAAAGQVELGGHSDLKPGSHLPTVEHLAQAQGDKTNRGSEVLGAAVTPQRVVGLPHKSTRYPFKAAEHITMAVAAMAIVAVMFSAVAFQKQLQKLGAQLTQSEAAMKALREQMRVDQRPWIGLTETTVQPLTRNGGGFTIKLQNTGKTPAVDLHISAAVRVEDISQAADLQAPDFASGDSAGTLMPGAAYTTDVWYKTSPDAMSGLARDELRVVNFVRVTYQDVYKGLHATKICFYWNSSLSRVKLCNGYNELN
jgi:type II secretory pathway pseudopilin PulG